ncbi:ATP-binding protein [Streptococcus salivarius]|uniref:ATP-binding protein n=1 Tax=Streptococcus salivarius TaxID=1304 RepID=UPI00066DADD2|nr:ATP-binding protein [Streptococcus salivarius]
MDFYTLSEHILGYTNSFGKVKLGKSQVLEDTIKKNEVEIVSYFSNISYPFKGASENSKGASEFSTFVSFVQLLEDWGMTPSILSQYTDNFYFGYKIPQIGKEFDLIRFGENYNVSIELKSQTALDEQEKQLKRNHFYLNFLDKQTRYYSFSPDIQSYVEYDGNTGNFEKINPEEFKRVLIEQEVSLLSRDEVDALFDIKNYLVSPFNDTKKFLKQQYFLNGHQEDIVDYILKPKNNERLFTIKGNPGTGKTLLIYHIANLLMHSGFRVVIIHGAKLNDGQHYLQTKGFRIKPITQLKSTLNDAKSYDYIIIDESQRLREESQYKQVSALLDSVTENRDTKYIISLDGAQTLSKSESAANANDILSKFYKLGSKQFSLKDKFRTNPDMNLFIKNLIKFPVDKPIEKVKNTRRNIQIKYFGNRASADTYLHEMEDTTDWHVLNYAKSRYTHESIDSMVNCGKVSHEVIGQEFDKVIIPMDFNFYYGPGTQEKKNKRGEVVGENHFMFLNSTDSYYPINKMFYQNITRSREQLQIVVIENWDLYIKICNLLETF